MKFKMKSLYFSPAGNTEKMAREIAKVEKAVADQIPPAYPCENEKLIFIGVELKGSKVDKTVIDLCRDLTPARAKNVAFYAVGKGDFSAIEDLRDIIKEKGLTPVGTTYECVVKGGLFKKGVITDEDLQGCLKWADSIVSHLAV